MTDAVLARLNAGDRLHMQFVEGRRVWWFEDPHAEVPDAIASRLQEAGRLVDLGDSLFGFGGDAQSFVAAPVDKPDRVRCINPRCRRTFKDEGGEVICGKCFRALPAGVRNEHRRLWREIRKWDRRISRTGDELKIDRMHTIRDRVSLHLQWHWDREIKPFFLSPAKPEGLDAFLEEVGL